MSGCCSGRGLFYTLAEKLLSTFRPEPEHCDCHSRRFNAETLMRQFEAVFLLRD
jgi:hypothetical protein